MRNKPKLIFLLVSISQPRCFKRIEAFIKEGFDLEVYGFDRGYYNDDSTIAKFGVNNLGFMPSGSGYLKKNILCKK